MDDRRSALEGQLKTYLVPLAYGINRQRPKVGLPLAASADGKLQLAYDTSAKNVVAVWQLASLQRGDCQLHYQAGLSPSNGLSFALVSRF